MSTKTHKIADMTFIECEGGCVGYKLIMHEGKPHVIIYNASESRGGIDFHDAEGFRAATTFEPGNSLIPIREGCHIIKIDLITSGIGAKPRPLNAAGEAYRMEILGLPSSAKTARMIYEAVAELKA